MKTLCVIIALSLCGIVAGQAQTTAPIGPAVPAPTAKRVVERGPNHRVWQWETYEEAPGGQIATRVHSYTELASGMHYKDASGQWQESRELIEAYPGGAIARQGPYQVIFANNLNTYGAIDMQTSGGKRLRSNILGLMYVDSATGAEVWIAQLKDSIGELVGDNQVLYAGALEGDGAKADVIYTFKRGKFEQDVVLLAQPVPTESYGMNPESTQLQVVTEFIDPPPATVTELKGATEDQSDQTVRWGTSSVGHGKAFEVSGQQSLKALQSVKKRYTNVEGRTILIEKVPLKKIQPRLSKLPLHAGNPQKIPIVASKQIALPKAPLARSSSAAPMKLALAAPANKGYVLDYVIINSSQADYTFQGDTTYFVSGECYLSGTTTIEGGAVIKMDGAGQIDIDQNGTLVCKTGSYRPAIFTSMNDDSVGDQIEGSSAAPALGDVFAYLNIYSDNASAHDLRLSYSFVGISHGWGGTPGTIDVWNCQFVYGNCAVVGYNMNLHNVLIGRSYSSDAAALVAGPRFTAEHVTADGGAGFLEQDYSLDGVAALTNCLITAQDLIYGNPVTISTNSTAWLPSPSSPVYQAVGAAAYYLADGSPYRDAGAIGLSPEMGAVLAQRTTYPPIVYSDTAISEATTLSPQAQRDKDVPDLGYHYDPIDYAFNMTSASANIMFAPGTAVACFSRYTSPSPGWGVGDPWGLALAHDVAATFSGTATDPCKLVSYNAVQEGSGNNWMWPYVGGICAVGSHDTDHFSTLAANFTLMAHPATVATHFRDYGSGLFVNAKNSEIYGSCGGYLIQFCVTNSLLFRVNYWQGSADSAYGWETYRNVYRNCTFHGGSWEYAHWEAAPYWKVLMQDCALDRTTINFYNAGGGMSWLTADYNSTNSTMAYGGNQLPGANNVPISGGYDWQTSVLGDFYLPANSALINAGSTTADQVGLYHYTTQINQTKEGTSPIDIGLHYLAAGAGGLPVDSDIDGIQDYLEDDNGNGIFDTGIDLSNWENPDMDNDGLSDGEDPSPLIYTSPLPTGPLPINTCPL